MISAAPEAMDKLRESARIHIATIINFNPDPSSWSKGELAFLDRGVEIFGMSRDTQAVWIWSRKLLDPNFR